MVQVAIWVGIAGVLLVVVGGLALLGHLVLDRIAESVRSARMRRYVHQRTVPFVDYWAETAARRTEDTR